MRPVRVDAGTLCLLTLLCAAARAASAPEGESLSVGDLSVVLRRQAPLLREKEESLRRAGIVEGSSGVQAELDHVAGMAKALEEGRSPEEKAAKAAALKDKAAPGIGASGGPLDQLKGSPGARAGQVPPVDPKKVLAFDKDGRPTEPLDEAAVRERVRRLVDSKVQASTAKKSYANLLWTAVRADPEAAKEPEVKGLLDFLRAQLDEKNDGKALWPVYYDPDMPPGILATYGGGVIKVGPSFSRMAEGGLAQMTTLFHEMLHGHDDGGDRTDIEVNRMTGAYPYDPAHADPAMRNAAEMLAYTDMAKWALAY